MLPVSQHIAERARGLELTAAERSRYSRHVLLPDVGLDGQKRLKAARILVVGAGGLGAPVSYYLAAAGVGTIGIVEFDTVDVTNLQRQILYTDADVGTSKLDAAVRRLAALAPHSQFVKVAEPLAESNAERLIDAYDLVIDGTDNFSTRYLINDVAARLGKPNVYGSIFRFDGQASVFYAPHGPCYRCLFPSPPPPEAAPNCAEGGVLGVLPGQIGLIQATEALKLVLGIGTSLVGRLLTFDALSLRFDEFKLQRDPDCAACGARRGALPLVAPLATCAPVVAAPEQDELITPPALAALRDSGSPHVLLDVRSPGEIAVTAIAGHRSIPVDAVASRAHALPRDVPLVCYCKSGARSLRAVRTLRAQGFSLAMSLDGGILAWIDQVAPDLPRY